MVKIERGNAHINGENVTTIEIWRTDPGQDQETNLSLVAVIPLDSESEKVQVDL